MIRRIQTVLAIGIAVIGSFGVGARKGVARDGSYQNQNDAEWQRYTVSNEEFSVLLPIAPAMNTSEAYLDKNKSRRERTLGAYANGVAYAIYTYEKKSLSLDDLIRRFEGASGLASQTEKVTVAGIIGKGFRLDNNDRMSVTQFFETARNLYVFQALGSKLGNPATGIPKFLSSIRLEEKPKGIGVVDGPGEQPFSRTESGQGDVFSGKLVTLKAAVLTHPEPRYTEEARLNQVTGTVVLRAVFSSSGAVTNIHAVSKLPDGLTERAIDVARQIRFIPAIKDGRFVSMWMELQYNFNLY